ncbi:MAG: hypothetical protein ACLSBH_13185 [Coprobacillus cateniformis]
MQPFRHATSFACGTHKQKERRGALHKEEGAKRPLLYFYLLMCNLRHKTENKGSCEEYCYKAVKSGKHIELYIYKDKNFKRKTKETNDLMKIINDWDITENEKKDKKKRR